MDQKIINLYDEYTHSQVSRKDFMRKLAILAGSTALAMTILPMLENNYAAAADFNSDDIEVENITYAGVDGEMKAVLAKPKGKKNLGCVLVIHENRGLNPHIIDVTKRVAAEGFLALGVDALSPLGGTPTDEDKGRELIGKLDPEKNLQNYLKGLDYLRNRKDGNGKVGCVGFCWGGGMANKLAVNDPKLQAAVAYYGAQANAADVPKIKASLMLHYGGLDERINAGIPAYEQALKDNKIDYKIYIYDGVNHAFNNNTSPTRYNEAAAKLAWSRTIDLFKQKLAVLTR
ncbi:dienelactone hydrolase family protein [Pedobacter sp. ISL-68]|uniref:dienelactone hydrolase family protein n=1 Tax=unclassified Pedobacter TaxID=2628915 RepID=UPI001BE92EF9|nr:MULTISPECIES: dienelactone hydrolase family protein [unclassified Pedobacter]MBT2560544.1 dienelactone hydrolase family protein [Pedobacter sp. ISL-64]MBT2593277.1 dienelactone hydrolase family protein [Pedobacter sp. ISL-68]